MEVVKNFEYKLYSNKKNRHLNEAIDLAAEIWNHCIALHRRYYKLTGKYISANRMKTHITKLKRRPKYAHWNELGSQAIQDVVERIDRSYKAFFTHVREKRGGKKSPPKFRKKNSYRSFTLKQAGYKFHEDNHITIMGRTYKYNKHRPLEGQIKTLTVKRNALGEFYLYVVCIVEMPNVVSRLGNATGYDFGLKHFLTNSDGRTIDSPQFYQRSLNELRKAHRALSSKEKGSNNRKRALHNLERQSRKVANQRKDWFYKLAKQLTAEHSVICLEDLNLKAMQKLWGRKISDYAYGEFVRILEWECIKSGVTLVKIDRWAPSTKACHNCGLLVEDISLKDREWTCACCGMHHDRDVNAAINIRNMGLAKLS